MSKKTDKAVFLVGFRDLRAGDKIVEIQDYGHGKLFRVRRKIESKYKPASFSAGGFPLKKRIRSW